MSSFWKDGKYVGCSSIGGDGRVGQVIILGRVSYGDKPDLAKYPLARYPQPHAFTIVEKVMIDNYIKYHSDDVCYILSDEDGNQISVRGEDTQYLYDASVWFRWDTERQEEELACKKRQIDILNHNFKLLREILVDQGVRVVSEKDAKQLGIS